MTSPMQRSRHSDLPEGPGFMSGFTNRADSQRDLWRFLLPYGHLQAAGLRGGGVVEGLRVSGAAGSPGLMVTPGQALDARGRLLVIPPPTGSDLVVRLRRVATADVGTEGLAAVGLEGVAVATTGLSGEHLLVMEWNETRLTLDGETVYRLTPWLRLERPPTAPRDEWVILARVTLGSGAEEGRVKSLDAGPRRGLTSLRDGLTIQRPLATTGPAGRLSVEQTPGTALRGRPDGGLEVSTWDTAASTWRAALSVDGAGSVRAGRLAAGALSVEGHVSAGPMEVRSLFVFDSMVVEGPLGAQSLSIDQEIKASSLAVNNASAGSVTVENVLTAGGIILESRGVPLVRTGSTDEISTPWVQNDANELFLRVDTSSTGFTETPFYTAMLHGAEAQVVTGVNCIANPTPVSFDLFIRTPASDPTSWTLSTQFARDRRWFIKWIAVLPR